MYRTALETQARAARQLCSLETRRLLSASVLVKEGESSTAARLGIRPDVSGDESFLPPESFGVSPKPQSSSSSASETLDRIFGEQLRHRSDSYYTERASYQKDGWSLNSLRELSRPSDHSPANTSPMRRFRGVHHRKARALGATPAEAEKFNSILASIFADLERTNGPLQPGSSATDPYGATLSVGATLARARRAGKLPFREDGEIDAITTSELEQLKEDLTALTTDSEVLDWAQENILKPTATSNGDLLYPKTYPHILAFAIRTLRVNYNNPHLALALFHHAQTVNLESYISGCLTAVYNEILQIRWDSFRDLNGVEAAVNEMDFNGLQWDKDTSQIIRTITGSVVNLWTAGIDPQDVYGPGAEDTFRNLEDRLNSDIQREKLVRQDKRSAGFRLSRNTAPPPQQDREQRQNRGERPSRGLRGRSFGLRGVPFQPRLTILDEGERTEVKSSLPEERNGETGGDLSHIWEASKTRSQALKKSFDTAEIKE